jgi:hypothetical protein
MQRCEGKRDEKYLKRIAGGQAWWAEYKCSVQRESIFWAGHLGIVIRHRMVMPVNAAECRKRGRHPARNAADDSRRRQA